MPIKVTCPSGLEGQVRGLTGKDGRFLTDRAIIRNGTLLDHILSACWLETTTGGIYKIPPNGNPNWAQVLQGDRTHALIQIKIAGSPDSTFTFKVNCANPVCPRRRFEWDVDLEDLPVRLLSEEAKEKLGKGENRFTAIMPGTEQYQQLEPGERDEDGTAIVKPTKVIVPGTGTKIEFSLPIGSDEIRSKKLARQNKIPNELLLGIVMRTKAIEGVELKRGKEMETLLDYYEEQDLQALATLLDRFDQQDCGVETTLEVECPECGALQDVNIPFDENFFFRRERRVVR